MPPQYTIYTKKNRNRYKNIKTVGGLGPFKGQKLSTLGDRRHTSKIREGIAKIGKAIKSVGSVIAKAVNALYNYWKVYKFCDFHGLTDDEMKEEASHIYKIFFYPNATLKNQNRLSRLTRATASSLKPSFMRKGSQDKATASDNADDILLQIDSLKELKKTMEDKERVTPTFDKLNSIVSYLSECINKPDNPSLNDPSKFADSLKSFQVYIHALDDITGDTTNASTSPLISGNSVVASEISASSIHDTSVGAPSVGSSSVAPSVAPSIGASSVDLNMSDLTTSSLSGPDSVSNTTVDSALKGDSSIKYKQDIQKNIEVLKTKYASIDSIFEKIKKYNEKPAEYSKLNIELKEAKKNTEMLLNFVKNYQDFLDKLISNIEEYAIEADQKYRYFIGPASLYCSGELHSEEDLNNKILEQILEKTKKESNTPMEEIYNRIVALLQLISQGSFDIPSIKENITKLNQEVKQFNMKEIDFPDFIKAQNTTQVQELEQYKKSELKKLDIRLKKFNVVVMEMLDKISSMDPINKNLLSNMVYYIDHKAMYFSYLYKTITTLKQTYNQDGVLDNENVDITKSNIETINNYLDKLDGSIGAFINSGLGSQVEEVLPNRLDNDETPLQQGINKMAAIAKSDPKSVTIIESSNELVKAILSKGIEDGDFVKSAILQFSKDVIEIYESHQMSLFFNKNEENNEDKLFSLLSQIYKLQKYAKENPELVKNAKQKYELNAKSRLASSSSSSSSSSTSAGLDVDTNVVALVASAAAITTLLLLQSSQPSTSDTSIQESKVQDPSIEEENPTTIQGTLSLSDTALNENPYDSAISETDISLNVDSDNSSSAAATTNQATDNTNNNGNSVSEYSPTTSTISSLTQPSSLVTPHTVSPSIRKDDCDYDYNKDHLFDNIKSLDLFKKYIERSSKPTDIIVFKFIGDVLKTVAPVNEARVRRELMRFKFFDTEYLIIVNDEELCKKNEKKGSEVKGGADPMVSLDFKHFFIKNASPTIASLRERIPNLYVSKAFKFLPLNLWRRFMDIDPYRLVFRNEYYVPFMESKYVNSQGVGLCSSIYKRACSELNDRLELHKNVFVDKDIQRLIFVMKYQYTKALRFGRLDFLILYFRIFANLVLGKKTKDTDNSGNTNLKSYEAKFADFIKLFAGDYNYGIFAFSDLANFIAGILKIMSICVHDTVRNGVFGDVPYINDLLMKKYSTYNKDDEKRIIEIEDELSGIPSNIDTTTQEEEPNQTKIGPESKGGSPPLIHGGLDFGIKKAFNTLISNPRTDVGNTVDSFLISDNDTSEPIKKAIDTKGLNRDDIIVITEYNRDTSDPAVNIRGTDFSKYEFSIPKVGKISKGNNYVLHMLNKYFDINESYGLFEIEAYTIPARGLVSFLAQIFQDNQSGANDGANFEVFERVVTNYLKTIFPMAARAQSKKKDNTLEEDPDKIEKWVKKIIAFSEKMGKSKVTIKTVKKTTTQENVYLKSLEETNAKLQEMDKDGTKEDTDDDLDSRVTFLNTSNTAEQIIEEKNSMELMNSERDTLAEEFVDIVTLTVDSRYYLESYEEISDFENGCIKIILRDGTNYTALDSEAVSIVNMNMKFEGIFDDIETAIKKIEEDDNDSENEDIAKSVTKAEQDTETIDSEKKKAEEVLTQMEKNSETIYKMVELLNDPTTNVDKIQKLYTVLDFDEDEEDIDNLIKMLQEITDSIKSIKRKNETKKSDSEAKLLDMREHIKRTLTQYKSAIEKWLEKTKDMKEDAFLKSDNTGSENPDLLIEGYKSEFAVPLSCFVIRDVHNIVEYLYQYLNINKKDTYYYPFHPDILNILDITFNVEYARMIEKYIKNAQANPNTGDEKLVDLMVSFSTSILLGFHMTGTTLAGIIPMVAMISSSAFGLTLLSPILEQIADPMFFNAGAILVRTLFSEWVDPKMLAKLRTILESDPEKKKALQALIDAEEAKLQAVLKTIDKLNPFSLGNTPGYLSEKEFDKVASFEGFVKKDNVGFLVFNTDFVIKKLVYTEIGKPIVRKNASKEIKDCSEIISTMMRMLINDENVKEKAPFSWDPSGFNELFTQVGSFDVVDY